MKPAKLAIILGKLKGGPKPEDAPEDMDKDMDEHSDEDQDAAMQIMEAIKGDDAQALLDALKFLISNCMDKEKDGDY